MSKQLNWRIHGFLLLGILLCAILVFIDLTWRENFTQITAQRNSSGSSAQHSLPDLSRGILLLIGGKLIASLCVGAFVARLYRVTANPNNPSSLIEQAHTLASLAGAIIMIIIGDSLPRAFGIIGGASFVRFRTLIKNPKDAIVLFLTLSLGMSCGLGAFAVTGCSAALLAFSLIALSLHQDIPSKCFVLTIWSESVTDELKSHVRDVLLKNGALLEVIDSPENIPNLIQCDVRLPKRKLADSIEITLREGPGATIREITWHAIKREK